MNPTRRLLCGLGVAGVPLAAVAPDLFRSRRGLAGQEDPLLAYLVEDAKRNCVRARLTGRARAAAVRSLGANVEVLTAYLFSRNRMADIDRSIRQQVRGEGVNTLAQRIGTTWSDLASAVAREYAVTMPEEPDHRTLLAAVQNLQRHGCPRLGGMRGWFEREADRLEQLEGRVEAVAFVTQTPGSDYGPPGWSAGLGDPDLPTCWHVGVIIAALFVLMEVVPELSPALGIIAAIMGLGYAIACTD